MSVDAFRRAAARRAGRASGVKRRQLARARRRPGPGQQALRFEHRKLSRREFDDRYEKLWPRPERPTAAVSWAKGRETLWEHQKAVYALVCVRGQHCGTTKGQRAKGLSSRGLARHPRTVRRLNLKLEAMGVAALLHRRKPHPQKDCLAVEWRMTRRLPILRVTPPPGTENPGFARGFSAVHPSRRPRCSTSTDLSPPASPANADPPDEPADRPVTEEEQLDAQIRFVQLKLDMNFGDPEAVRRTLWTLLDRRRQLGAQATAMPERQPMAAQDSGDPHSAR